jgi:hypothetical protein
LISNNNKYKIILTNNQVILSLQNFFQEAPSSGPLIPYKFAIDLW